ncbi:4-coumarate--CoA ligase-like [Lachnellula subtilissima]|uniref:4-coumarate--CoA ligase-like n=1 Tax=Lachnellula subtilissima TaxID=602034 RepID=A0A8H8UAP4_9HELO|nr:4-coumarate--CoA ligase-like [Lachnellula subtilissima]
MVYKSPEPPINAPLDETVWSWLFDSKASPLTKYATSEIKGFTNVTTQERLSYLDVKQYSIWLSSALAKRYGIVAKDVVAIFSPNTIWYPVAMFAVSRLGGVICGASPSYNVEEMTTALTVAGAKFLFTVSSCIDIAEASAKKSGIPRQNIILLEGEVEGYQNLRQLIHIGRELGSLGQIQGFRYCGDQTAANVCAFLGFTSGTTGVPKAVMISHRNVIAQCLQVQAVTPLDHKKTLAALPLYHITGLVHILHLPILLNAEVFMLPSFTLESMLETVTQNKIEELLLVPPILIRMVHDPIVDRYDLRHIRRFSTGAAPISGEIIELLSKKFPQTGFKQQYGMTESCSCITSHTPKTYDYKFARTVGTAMPSTELKVVDSNDKEVETGEPGELLAKGPQITMGYLENEEATRESFTRDGFLRTGDEATIDKHGMVSITDRIKEMIKVKGIAVAPAELEDLLLGHPLIDDVAVVGISDPFAGERPKAFIVRKQVDIPQEEAKLVKELVDYVSSRKARHKWIREVEFVEIIPKSASGKILRKELRKRKGKEQITKPKL